MLVAMAAAVLWLGGYAVLCAVRPFAPCRRCGGLGEIEHRDKTRMCPCCLGKKLGSASAAAPTTPGAGHMTPAPAEREDEPCLPLPASLA